MSKPLPNVFQQFMWNGAPVAGGKLYSYAAGTNTPISTYTDQGALTQNANPTILSSSGVAKIWIPQTTGYKFQLQDANNNILWTYDNIYLIENGSIGSAQFASGGVVTSNLAAGAVTSAKFALGAVGATQIAAGAVGTAQLATGGIEIQNFEEDIDLTTLSNSVDGAISRYDDPITGGALRMVPQYPNFYPSITLLGTPGTLPAGVPNACKFSPDGRFVAFGHSTTPFVTIYERSGATFTKLPNPGSLPAGTVNGLGWSPDGNLLVCAHSTTPFITSYQRQGLNFTKLGTPGTLPSTTGRGAWFSPNGEFLQVANNHISLGNGSVIYQVNGTTLTSLGDIIGGADGSPSTAWSPDSQYIFGQDGLTGIAEIYQRTGTTFQALGFAETLFTSTWGSTYGLVTSASWSPDGQTLALGVENTPFIQIYQWANQALENLALPAFTPEGTVNALEWSRDSKYLAIGYTGSVGCVDIYQNNFNGTISNTWVALAPNSLVQANGISWSPSTQFLSVATQSSPYINIYESNSSFPTNGSLYSRNFADV